MKHIHSRIDYSRVAVVFALCLLTVCVGLGATSAEDEYKAGARYEKQGQSFRAAEAYARALRLKPATQKARQALERIADRAIGEKIQRSEALNAELKVDEAIAELDSAVRLHERLAELNIELRQPIAIDAMRDELVSQRIRALLAEAETARADGLWSAAIAHLDRIESLSPGFEDTRDRLYDLWVSWGDMNFREGRLRAAAERYERAAQVPATRSDVAAARAAAIRAGLGAAALTKGACRAAVADLRKADRLAAGSVETEVLGRAASCASTCVQMTFTSDPDAGLTDDQLVGLAAEVRNQIGAGASEFLRLRTSGADDMSGCGRRTMPGVSGEPMEVGPYTSVVRVTSLIVIRQPASSATRQTRVEQQGAADTVVTYEEYEESFFGTISGWVTVKDRRAGSTAVPFPVRVNDQATVRWNKNPLSTITREDTYTGRRDTAVRVDLSGRGKAQAESERREARRNLVESLIQSFAKEAAQLLLSTVDVEPAVADPRELAEVKLP